MKRYYYAGGVRVAMRTGASTLNYLFGDHQGSTAITADSNGAKVAELRYKPWGEDQGGGARKGRLSGGNRWLHGSKLDI